MSARDAGEALWRRLTVPQAHRRVLLDRYRDEVLREAAARIRATQDHLEGGEWLDNAGGMLSAADLIDPDKQEQR